MRHSLWAFIVLVIAGALGATQFTSGAPIQPEERLIDLARERFKSDTLVNREAFTEFFQNAEEGAKTDLRTKDTDPSHLDPCNADVWSNGRIIRAEWVEWLCKNPKVSSKVPAGLELAYARIVGDLNLAFSNIPFSLVFYRCTFDGQIVLNESTIQSLRLQSSCIEGLHATGLSVKQDLFLSDGFQAKGTVWLRNSVITGSMMCDGAHFQRDPPPEDLKRPLPHALNLNSARIGAGLSLKNCTAVGVIVIDGAQIEGNLDCEGAKIDGRANDPAHPRRRDDNAIYAPSMKVGGDVRLCEGFDAHGTVLIRGTTIRGELDCHAATFSNGEETSLFAILINVGSDVLLNLGFNSTGEVDLRGATIGGNLDCENGHFSAPSDRTALSLVSAKIGGNVLLKGKFTARGTLDFSSALVDRSFVLDLNDPLDVESSLILQNARAGVLLNRQRSWPSPRKLNLDGFTFTSLDSEAPSTADLQKQWLAIQLHPGSSQPYEQLATVFRGMGLDDDARGILIAKNEKQGEQPVRIKEFVWYRIFGPSIGFGYTPWNAFYISIVVVVIGYGLFKLGKHFQIVTPTKYDDYQRDRELYPKFNAFIYSLETFVPLVKLGVGEYWMPNANRGPELQMLRKKKARKAPHGEPTLGDKAAEAAESPTLRVGSLLRCYYWVHIILGWVLTTLWVGGLTGLIKT